MYDNIDFILNIEKTPGEDYLKNIPQFLSSISSQGYSKFGEYINGYSDSLKVSITANRVKIYDSSLCKYYLGENFKTLTRVDTKNAIEKISNHLHLPFSLAKIGRIDFSQNIIMKYPANLYYPYLGEALYYNRLEQNNGLYYNLKTGKRQLLFYGKIHEQKEKRQPIPELYNGRNLLRFEARYKKDIVKQLNCPAVTGEMLYNENFYHGLVARWKQEYFSIQKIQSKIDIMKPTGSTKELIENLALYTLLDIGQPKVLRKIKEWQESGEISKKQAADHRHKLRQLSNFISRENSNEMITELDRKINEATHYC